MTQPPNDDFDAMVRKLDLRMSHVEEHMGAIKQQMDSVTTQMDSVTKQMDGVTQEMRSTSVRMEGALNEFRGMRTDLVAFSGMVGGFGKGYTQQLADLTRRVEALERKTE